MDIRKPAAAARSEQQLEQAIHTLAMTIREAAECLLDLQLAVETLHLTNEPGLAQAVSDEAAACIRAAMRR
jgi:hypothetical protein